MPIEIALWRIGEKLDRIGFSQIDTENRLEHLLADNITIVGSNLLVIGRQVPTSFGKVGYTITSSVEKAFIEAVIHPPARTVPGRIVVRLRHPRGKAISYATVNGLPHQNFDPEKECVAIDRMSGLTTVRVQY